MALLRDIFGSITEPEKIVPFNNPTPSQLMSSASSVSLNSTEEPVAESCQAVPLEENDFSSIYDDINVALHLTV